MSKPRVDSTLKFFHDRSLIALDGLHRWLQRSARNRDHVQVILQDCRSRWLGAVRDSVADFLAAQTHDDDSRAFRNAVSAAIPEDLDFWRHALESGALDAFGAREQLDAVLQIAEARAPRSRRRYLKSLRLLERAAEASAADLLPLVESAWPVALVLLTHMPIAEAREALPDIVRASCAKIRRGGPRGQALVARRMGAAVIELFERRPGLRLGLAQFERLPSEFLAELKSPDNLLSPRGLAARARRQQREEIAKNRLREQADARTRRVHAVLDALFAPDAAPTPARWRELIRAFKSLAECVAPADRARVDSELLRQVASRSAHWAAVPPARQASLAALRTAAWTKTAGILVFLASPRRVQCRARWASVRPAADFPNLAQSAPELAAAISMRAVDEYIRVPADRAEIWTAWGPRAAAGQGNALSAVIEKWSRVFTRPRVLESADLSRLIEWLELATPGSRCAFERRNGAWLDAQASTRQWVEWVLGTASTDVAAMLLGGSSVRRYASARKTLDAMDPRTRRRLAPNFRPLLACSLAPCGLKGCIADGLAKDGPRKIGLSATMELLAGELNADRLETILSGTPKSPLNASDIKWLSGRAVENAGTTLGRAMATMLQGRVQISKAVLKSIWRGALGSSKAHAVALLERCPERFASHAVGDLDAEDLLITLASASELLPHIERSFDRPALLAALPAVRARLADRPLMLAVIELALMSDLREFGYLRMLARMSYAAREEPDGTRFDERYETFEIPKRSGGTREIAVPDRKLKRLQRRLLAHAFDPVPLHDAAHGFRKGRSILSNAQVHVGRRLVVNVDIKGFFPSTAYDQVLSACFKVDGGRISPRGARLLAEICCYQGALPTGAPTSPAIGNIVLRRADRAIAKVAAARGIAYTRYADDLTFSGDFDTKKILPFVRKVLADCGYRLDAGKTQLYRRGRQQLVTNLVVNDRANLRRSDRRRLRAAIDRRCKGGEVEWHARPMDDSELQGRLALLSMIDRPKADAYRKRLGREVAGWGSSDA